MNRWKKSLLAIRIKLESVSLFWRYMVMMLCILLMCLSVLVISNQRSLKSLTAENMEKIQITLNRDCESLDTELYGAYYIPYAIEDSQFYPYIRNSNSGVLEKEGHSILCFMRDTVSNQIYQQADSDRVVVYLLGTNSICTASLISPKAEQYFEKYMLFSETDGETILSYLRERNSIKLLPVQKIRLTKTETTGKDRLTLLIHPKNNRVAVLSVYSVSTILEKLSIPYLPEGTHLELRDKEGTVLMQYPAAITDEDAYICI